jgi:ribonuclease HI
MTKVGINPTNRDPLRPQSYFFSNDGKDFVRQIFGTCKTINPALRSTARAVGIRFPRRETMMSITTLTTEGTTPTTPLFPVFIITFVWAVWSGRQHLFSALKQPPPPVTIVAHLETYTCTHLPQPQRKRTTPETVISLTNNPPPEVLVGFADGSSIPNPGPCGADALLFPPHNSGTAISTMSLGLGDNNLGEIAGLPKILRLVDEGYTKGRINGHPALLLFTDSLLVVGALEWGWSTRNMPQLIGNLRRVYRQRKTINSVTLYWVQGHSQIIYNEVVDKRAKVGVRWSQEGFVCSRTKWN